MDKICTTCGHKGPEKSRPKGTFLGELGLWMVGLLLAVLVTPIILFVPLIYSLWRLVSRQRICSHCGNPTMIPLDSPLAAKLLSDLEKPE